MTRVPAVRPQRTTRGVVVILDPVPTMAFADAVVKLVSAPVSKKAIEEVGAA